MTYTRSRRVMTQVTSQLQPCYEGRLPDGEWPASPRPSPAQPPLEPSSLTRRLLSHLIIHSSHLSVLSLRPTRPLSPPLPCVSLPFVISDVHIWPSVVYSLTDIPDKTNQPFLALCSSILQPCHNTRGKTTPRCSPTPLK